MAVVRTCPVYRADVLFEQSCITCPCSDKGICLIMTGSMKAILVDGVITPTKGGK